MSQHQKPSHNKDQWEQKSANDFATFSMESKSLSAAASTGAAGPSMAGAPLNHSDSLHSHPTSAYLAQSSALSSSIHSNPVQHSKISEYSLKIENSTSLPQAAATYLIDNISSSPAYFARIHQPQLTFFRAYAANVADGSAFDVVEKFARAVVVEGRPVTIGVQMVRKVESWGRELWNGERS